MDQVVLLVCVVLAAFALGEVFGRGAPKRAKYDAEVQLAEAKLETAKLDRAANTEPSWMVPVILFVLVVLGAFTLAWCGEHPPRYHGRITPADWY